MSGAHSGAAAALPAGVHHRVEGGCVIIANANTTIGYARFSRATATLDYIFVSPSFRRRGYGRRLVALAEQACAAALTPAPPLSPLGERFVAAVGRAPAPERSSTTASSAQLSHSALTICTNSSPRA